MIHSAAFLQSKFEQGFPYDQFVALGQPHGHDGQWHQRHRQLELSDAQQALVAGFTRRINVICLTGTWCGDCALQGAAMQRIAEANPAMIQLRFLMRDDTNAEMIVANQLNAGFRVPITYFCAEDFEPVSRIGDRTLSRYRSMARKQLPEGAATVLAPPPADPVRTVLEEVLDELERVHLLLRMSPRLREAHSD